MLPRSALECRCCGHVAWKQMFYVIQSRSICTAKILPPLAAMGQDSHESRGHMNSGTFFSQSQSCFFPFITSLVNPSLASQHKACCLVRWWVLAGSSLQPNAVQAGKLVILHDYCHTMEIWKYCQRTSRVQAQVLQNLRVPLSGAAGRVGRKFVGSFLSGSLAL